MKLFIKLLILISVFSGCNSNKRSYASNETAIHKVIVQEVLPVKEYSYIRVLDDEKEIWIAVPSTPVVIGQTYYFEKSMEMKNFESKELNKTFETVFFIEKLNADPDGKTVHKTLNTKNLITPNITETLKPAHEKKEVNVETSRDTISIA